MVTEKQPDDAFVSTREAADSLGVSVRTVQLWVENGVLHAWKTAGGHRRIARASVETVLAQQQAVIETANGLKLLNVVLIDDNPAQLKLYKLKLESLDLPLLLTTAADGFEGMLAVGRANPDVVIVSLDLAGIDAIEMVSSIAQRSPSTQIIALSAKYKSDGISAFNRLAQKITVLSPVDDLDAIGPLLTTRRPPVHEKSSVSPNDTYVFEDEDVERLDNLTLTSVIRDASGIEDRLPEEPEESPPSLDDLAFDSLVPDD